VVPAATLPRRVRRPLPGAAILRYDAPWIVLLAGLLVWVQLGTQTGQDLQSVTPVFVLCAVVAGVFGLVAAVSRRTTTRPWGVGTAVAAVAVVLVTGASITWSVSPSTSWFETNRILAYLAVLLTGLLAARLAPRRWAVLPSSVLLATSIVLVLGLLSKVFPESFAADEIFARLQHPLGYWNAVGAVAATNLVLALWFGTRRHGYRPVNALAYPAIAIAMTVLLMSYSRGALIAAGIGVLIWLIFAPRRLHSLLLLAVGGVAGLFVGVWSFANTALSTDNVILAARESSGTQLGVLLLATIVLLLLIGLAIEFSLLFTGIRWYERRRLGLVILSLAALVPLAGCAVLASSERGLGGSVSHAWKQLSDPEAGGPSSDPTRLGAVGSQRSLYWRQAFDAHRLQPLHGVGAGGFGPIQSNIRGPYPFPVTHAHGWVPQTLADGGWVTLGVQVLFAITWLLAALRALGAWGPLRHRRLDPEHGGITAMVAVVGVFAATTILDWTWFIPALALPVALYVGWVAGRGEERAFEDAMPDPVPAEPHPRRWYLVHGPVAALVLIVTAATVVSMAQPWRAERLQDEALNALDAGDTARAEQLAEQAASINPLSPRADYALAQVRVAEGRIPDARALYRDALALEPSVVASWQRWAEFELRVADNPKEALRLAGIALKMGPAYQPALRTSLAAQQALAAAATPPPGAAATGDPAGSPAGDDPATDAANGAEAPAP
jgi:hypothetical protein